MKVHSANPPTPIFISLVSATGGKGMGDGGEYHRIGGGKRATAESWRRDGRDETRRGEETVE
ncbi:hypothetical protein CTA1_12918 [Colletotrichum tanaceti]|uniref:Uncharacterized protein n=1 Tax=Colletotrichum tanaceti TaxID=1306861 RepID=A0A4U6X3U2_9PEZI|nr:hypothetical protein CTA1_12918 [Colletotrichum tanaceti]